MSQRPDMRGRVCLVTGANTGIGRVTALELARAGAEVVVACRSEEKAQPVLDEIKAERPDAVVSALALELSDLKAVARSADAYLERKKPLHVLINNAGLAGKDGLTKDGFEMAFGVNHLGTFLFTTRLLERIKESAPARIINVASKAHYKAKGIDFDAVRRKTAAISGLPEYEVSKLANVLFTKELARRLEGTGVTTYALHPGVVATDVWREIPWPVRTIMKWFMISEEEGAKTQLRCAWDPALASETGLYYDEEKLKEPSAVAKDEALAAELWRRSEAWVAEALQ